MDFSDQHQRTVFFDVHEGLARQGPGNKASGAKALALAQPLPAAARVLDVACGPGLQTVELAEMMPEATIVATDLHQPFLDQLRILAAKRGVSDRIETRLCDMAALDVDASVGPGEIDLIWCEGAAYIMGFAEALVAWKRFLAPGGCLALTEPVWLAPDPPAKVTQCWEEYPGLADLNTRSRECEAAGYEVLGHFVLPDEAWWDHYYGPLGERLAALRTTYAGDAVAQSVLDETQLEIECHRDHSAYYSYAFFVLTPTES